MSAGCGDLAQSFEAKQERRRKARPRKKSKKEKRINRAEHFSPLSSSIHLSGKQTWHFRQKHLWADSLDSSSRSTFSSSSSFNLPQTRIASLSCPEGRISCRCRHMQTCPIYSCLPSSSVAQDLKTIDPLPFYGTVGIPMEIVLPHPCHFPACTLTLYSASAQNGPQEMERN